MTTEDDFHRALDANPDDHHTRLVFADWLDEHDDPRGSGYRALGKGWSDRLVQNLSRTAWVWHNLAGRQPESTTSGLPHDWFSNLVGYSQRHADEFTGEARDAHFPDRRTAEDAAALAFSQLPPERQQEIVNPQPAPEQLTRRRLARRKYRG